MNIKLSYGSQIAHNAQILTGYNILTDGECEIDKEANKNLPPLVIVAEIDGVKIGYDTCDGYFHNGAIGVDERYVKLSDSINVLYKRDYNSEIKKELLKFHGEIKPLGLNYFCYDKRIKKIFYPGIKNVKNIIKLLITADQLNYWERYEVEENLDNNSCDVLFLTRLWNPNSCEVENSSISEERRQINEMRINIIRELRKKYGSKAICGLSDDAYSREIAPDLIVNKFSKRKKYINLMKNAKVVVSSLGLHKSNGWKIAEYMVAGKAIVMEKPFYEIPYAQKGINWLEYTNANECIQAIENLLQDNILRKRIEQNNKDYYINHLKPDALIKDTLLTEKII